MLGEEECFARYEPRSRLYRTDFRPRILRTSIGVKIAELDPDGIRFKVFFYPDEPDYPAHAEVWFAQEWENSNTKLFVKRAQSQHARTSANITSDKADLIYAHLTKVMLFPKNQRTIDLCAALGACPDKTLYEQFQFPEELINQLTSLQNHA